MIVVNPEVLRIRIERGVVRRLAGRVERQDQRIRGAVVLDLVVEELDLVVGEHHEAGAGRHGRDDVALGREVVRVVVVDVIGVDARLAPVLDRQPGKIEDQDAAGQSIAAAAEAGSDQGGAVED